MILDERNVSEKIAKSEESRHPRQSSDQIITKKPFVRHLTNACHKRCKRANDWDKPRNRNLLAAVLGKKYLRLLNIFHLDKSDFLALIDLLAALPSNLIVQRISADSSNIQDQQ